MKQRTLYKFRLLLPLVTAALLMPTCMAAQSRVAVVSDIHVMAPSLLPEEAKSQTAWTTYYAGQRKMLDKSAALFDQFMAIMATEKPDLLLITGDLTKDGEQVSHEYVRAKLAAAGIPTFVIPGNHDFGQEGNNTQFNADGSTASAPTLAIADFPTFYKDCGYGEGSTLDPNGSLSYVAEPLPGLVLLAIDSHNASVPTATLTWICDQAKQASAMGKQVIAMMHHPLFPHILGADMFISTYTVADYATVRNALIAAGVKVILTGHFHVSDIAYDWNNDDANGIYDINTGSLIAYPCDYRMLTLSNNLEMLDVETTSLEVDGSKEWMHDRLQTMADGYISAKYPSLATFKGLLAPMIADTYIAHSEGDENVSDDAKDILDTYNTLKPMAAMMGYGSQLAQFEPTLYSILEDKSNYGTDHENQTPDRSLSITLPSLDETLSITASGWATYCTGHNLDITETVGLKAYFVTAITASSTALLEEVTLVPADAGFLLFGEPGTYTLRSASESEGFPVGNLLKGTLAAAPAPEGSYVLATKNEITGFYPAQTGLEIPAHKAYLVNTSGARILTIDGDASGIATLNNDETANGNVYTLQGIRANMLRPGIYLRNGKKMIIK